MVNPAAFTRRRKWPLAIAAAGVLVALLLGAWLFMPKEASPETAAPAAQVQSGPPSIAVLPFANLTSDPEQEYFSDGLAEELLNELAQIQGLRVIGRTSSFAFKGRTETPRRIGEILGVNHMLVGTVRKSGDRLRISAQLINPTDGSSLWSKVYERKLDDIFAIQEEIAATVAGALRITLTGDTQVLGGTRNFAAYDALLAGRAGLNSNSIDILTTMGHLERAVTLDPEYLTAWIWLIDAYTRGLFYPPLRESSRTKQVRAFEKVVSLAPNSDFASLARSYRALVEGDLLESESLLSASLEVPAGLGLRARLRYGQFLLAVGRSRDAVETLKQVLAADPLDVFSRLQLILAYEVSGDLQQAVDARNALLKLPGGDSPAVRGQQLTTAMARGDTTEVVRLVAETASLESPLLDALKKQGSNLKAALPEIRSLLEDERYNQQPILVTNIAGWAGYLGDSQLALAALRKAQATKLSFETLAWTQWRTSLRDTRRTAGFKALVRDLKLDAYWRSTGNWGDFCRPLGSDDFECN
jgi:TolB-like protein